MSTNRCPYCGNNPVNHRAIKLAESIDLLLTPMLLGMNRFHHPIIDKVIFTTIKLSVFPLKYLGVWSFHEDISQARSDRSKVIWSEAQKRGIRMQGISVWGKPIEQYRAHVEGKWRYFESLPIPTQYNQHTFTWIDDKAKLRAHLQKNNIPVAHGGYAKTFKEALEIFKSGTQPFIVKPRTGSRGRHTTTHIYTKEELKEAFTIAKQLCYSVIVEEHLQGSVYRGTYVNGEVVGILRGDTAKIIGDGKQTIKELISKKNASKHAQVSDVSITPKLKDFLTRQKLSLSTVLKRGQKVTLSEKIGAEYGGFRAEMLPRAHPKILEYLKKAGDSIGCIVVGFDFIINDVTGDPDTQKWGIIEANSLPFIDLHHAPLAGKPINVAAKIWNLWTLPPRD